MQAKLAKQELKLYEAKARFVQSYGAFNSLCKMLLPLAVLQMQAISRWFYTLCIPRVQFIYRMERFNFYLVAIPMKYMQLRLCYYDAM